MIKSSLTKQLFLIYTIVLVFTTLTFYSVLSSWLIQIYSDINYSKLDDFSYTLETLLENDYDLYQLGYTNNIEFIIWNDSGYIYQSENVFDIIDADYVLDLYEKLELHLEESKYYRSELDTIADYFYSVTKSDNGEYYIFTISNGVLISMMQSKSAFQIMILFLLTLLAGGLIIGFWSSVLVKRITNINTHVKQMPKDNYTKSYLDVGKDELGYLATSIDDMREQIYFNEETKKEILQNLSHDIKTPLAVIKSYAEAVLDGVETVDANLVIIKQSDLLQHKVEKLLQLNRLNYLENDTPFEPINISNVINRVVHNTKYLTDVKFELSLDNTVFYGYEENYQTVIENIISNAIRYAKSKIVITLKDDKLFIYNDGAHIEDKFLDATFKAYEKGSLGVFGVGMSIVKKTTEFFKLDLYVKNEEIGVTFIIDGSNVDGR